MCFCFACLPACLPVCLPTLHACFLIKCVARHCPCRRCPADRLPAELAQQQQEMMRLGTWPIMRFLMVIGPSCIVQDQRGAYALLPLDHRGGELQEHIHGKGSTLRSTFSFTQQMQQRILEQHSKQRSQPPIKFEACLTTSMTGFYTGAPRATEVDGDGNLAATLISTGDGTTRSWIADPRHCCSAHVLCNLGHSWAAVLRPVHMGFPAADGARTAHMLLQAVQYRDTQHLRLKQLQGVNTFGGLVELTWDYEATTTGPSDSLTKVRCCCACCALLPMSQRQKVVRLRTDCCPNFKRM
jgi:hypothetical protein